MLFKASLTATFVLLFGIPSHAAPNIDELVALLLEDFGTHDEACRGGSGDKNETWVACGSRDYAATLLNEFGWCHGENGQSAYEMVWHQCSSNSLLHSGE